MATQNYKNQLKGQNGINFKKYWNGRGEKSENTIRIFCRKERLEHSSCEILIFRSHK